MPKQLNGWRRLWIVLSILGLFYAAYFALDDAHQQYKLNGKVLLGFSNPQCKAIVEMPAGYKLVQYPGLDNPCFDLHLYRSIYEDARNTSDGYAEHMGALQRKRILETFGFAVVVWFFSVLMLYAVGATIAWIIRGFRNSTT
jgi:hypothetical protein